MRDGTFGTKGEAKEVNPKRSAAQLRRSLRRNCPQSPIKTNYERNEYTDEIYVAEDGRYGVVGGVGWFKFCHPAVV